ncbi:hypothetical protein OG799_29695 [Micromonospora sp. NBC_00898]|uniref:TlpA family protein disulfide reductase n=1 Tax=Micromonospora sp. NBC_00898 TaxID=2975981 RepID=UPI003864FA81|nr:hypothetical protein OG799_29695 [Micromonospora sp. NBC_00898]
MLSAIVAVVGIVLAGNVVLTLALARRMKELENSGGSRHGDPFPARGTRVGRFAAVDLDGTTLTNQDLLEGVTFAAFLMPGCGPCEEVRSALHGLSPQQGQLMVFVAGDAANPETQKIVGSLPDRARVLVASAAGDLFSAFGVTAFPTVMKLVNGVVEMAASRVEARQAHAAEVAG